MPYKAPKQQNIIVDMVLCGKGLSKSKHNFGFMLFLAVYLTCLFVDIGATLFEAFTRCSTRCKLS